MIKRLISWFINVTDEDRKEIEYEGLKINHCESYIYLGAVFTSDGLIKSVLKENAFGKMCNVQKNFDFPFYVKKTGFIIGIYLYYQN